MKKFLFVVLTLIVALANNYAEAQVTPPAEIGGSANIVMWLSPDTALYNTSGSVASVGEDIKEWHDISSNNEVFTNSDNSRLPQLIEYNGKKYLDFTPGDFLENTNIKDVINGLDEFSIFVVVKSDDINTDQGFLDCEDPESEDDNLSMRYDADGANTGRTNCLKFGLLGNNANNQVETTANTQTTDIQVITMTWSSGGRLKSYLDGVPNDSSDNILNGPLSGISKILIGKGPKDNAAGRGWDGYIGTVIFYNREFPADTIKVVSDAAGSDTFYSIASGNWSDNATWSYTGHSGAAAASSPGLGDEVYIQGHDVTVDSDQECRELNISVGDAQTSLTVDDADLTVSGDALFENSGKNFTGDLNLDGTATMQVDGDLNVNRSGGNERFRLRLSNTSDLTVGGDLNFTTTGGTSSNSLLLIRNTASLTVDGNIDFSYTSGVKYILRLNNNAVVTAGGDINFSDVSANNKAQVELNDNSALYLAGNVLRSVSNYGRLLFNDNSTLILNGSDPQVLGQNAGGGSDSFVYKNLTIDNSSSTSPQITMEGDVTLDKTLTLTTGTLESNGKLTIDLTTDGNISGTGSGSITGNVTYLRSVTPGWHYFGIPLTNGAVNDFNDDLPYVVNGLARYYWYKESYANTNIQKGWEAIRTASFSMALMRGVCAYVSANTTFDVTGPYDHTASFSSRPLTYTSSGVNASDGWHLLGNPYPSTLDWESATGWTKTNINDAIYFFDGTLDIVKSYVSGAGTNDATQYIPSMQAVFVQALPGGGSLSVNRDARSANSGSFLRKSMNLDVLKIRISSGNYSDETIVRFTDDAGSFFDSEFDAYKLMNGSKYPSLYTGIADDLYSINTLPSPATQLIIPLFAAPGFDGSYELTFDLPSGFDPSLEVLLEDHVTGELVNLRMQNSYSFTTSVQDNPERFSLIFRQPVITGAQAKNVTDLFEVYNTGEKVFVNVTTVSNGPVRVDLINSLGQIVRSSELLAGGPVLFVEKGAVDTGLYIVRMTSGSDSYAQQVFLRR